MKDFITEIWNSDEQPNQNGPKLTDLCLFGFRNGPPHIRKYMACQAIFTLITFIVYYHLNGGIVPWFLLTKQVSLKPADVKLSVDVLKFFPQTDHDGTKVTWSHGTNSKALLDDALKGSAMMIEGDVGLKGMNTEHRQMVAVMAQPPASDSDITFSEWLDNIMGSDKGIKLDFMHIESVELALQKLKSTEKERKGPVHISGAIVNGPNSNAAFNPPLDPSRFLRLAKTHTPKATLVLGWADAPATTEGHMRYSWGHVMEMQEVVDHWKLKQPVSYTVRASLARTSMPQLKWLMEMTDRSSMTIVAPKGDEVPVSDMIYVRNKLPKNRVLYDLHSELLSQFEPVKNQASDMMNQFKNPNVHDMNQRTSVIKEDNTFRGTDWMVGDGEAEQKIYLGTEALVVQKGLLLTKRQVEQKENKDIKIYGRIEFFNFEEANSDIGFEVFLQSTKRVKQSKLDGLKCRIDVTGEVSVSLNAEKIESANIGGTAPCFMFVISYQPGKNVEMTVMRSKSCDLMPEIGDSKNTEGVVRVEMDLSDVKRDGKYIAIRHNDDKSFVAIDQFRIET